MLKWRAAVILGGLAALLFAAQGVSAQDRERRGGRDGDYELLGARPIGFSLDREVIDVGRRAGRIESLRLRARRNTIAVEDLRVIYANGQREDIRVDQRLREDDDYPVRLARPGFIERIEILARQRPSLDRRGVLEVYGEIRPEADDGEFELIGRTVVGPTLDRDVIDIDSDRRYRSIRLTARNENIFVREFRVVLDNGRTQDFEMRGPLREDQSTEPIRLREERAGIRRIDVLARSRGAGFRRRAVLEVYGERRGGRPERKWEELGCQKVGFLADRDVIRVGRNEGRFRSLQLRVSGNDVFLANMQVVYANGAQDDYRVNERIPKGGQTGPIDVRGERRGRAIDRIVLVYRSKLDLRGAARVCVYGRD